MRRNIASTHCFGKFDDKVTGWFASALDNESSGSSMRKAALRLISSFGIRKSRLCAENVEKRK